MTQRTHSSDHAITLDPVNVVGSQLHDIQLQDQLWGWFQKCLKQAQYAGIILLTQSSIRKTRVAGETGLESQPQHTKVPAHKFEVSD